VLAAREAANREPTSTRLVPLTAVAEVADLSGNVAKKTTQREADLIGLALERAI
jgi:hypothetical protein